MRAAPLVLASSSAYRRELLARLGLPFSTANPDVDETPLPGETPDRLVRRLAESKARKLAAENPTALIIGADQVALVDGTSLSKPGGHREATHQLRLMRRREVTFYTGLSLFNAVTATAVTDCIPFRVLFRDYSDAEIERYLQRERPYRCAGSFMSEGLGIALVERLQGEDPSALIGLPLVRLAEMLRGAGVQVP
jgi:septum formation protein